MENLMLRQQEVLPTEELIEKFLGESFPVYKLLIDNIIAEPYTLSPEWNYYRDGNAWLCKVQHKKKTVFWLSVWEGYFKVTFYFTEKTSSGIAELNIDEKIKHDFINCKPNGKFLPLTLVMKNKEQLADLLKITEYKKGLK